MSQIIPTPPDNSPLTVYDVLYKSTPGDVAIARRAFIKRYGAKDYNRYLYHFLERHSSQLLVWSPHKLYMTWMWNKLGQIMVDNTGRQFIPPVEWMAIDPDNPPMEPCVKCGGLVNDETKRSGKRWDIPGPICIVCEMELMGV